MSVRVLLFVEDAAHLDLLRTVIARVAYEEHVSVEIQERNAVGGSGQALTALKQYVQDLAAGREAFSEVLVVVIDGNCQGVNERVRQIEAVPRAAGYAGHCVPAVPDPHVESWYLADGQAVAAVAGNGATQEALPPYKCEPDRYKHLLREVFHSAGLSPPLGGSEFGDEIGAALDLDRARRAQASFERFLTALRAALRACKSASADSS